MRYTVVIISNHQYHLVIKHGLLENLPFIDDSLIEMLSCGGFPHNWDSGGIGPRESLGSHAGFFGGCLYNTERAMSAMFFRACIGTYWTKSFMFH